MFLTMNTALFFGNPLTQEVRTIRECDALKFANCEKVDDLAIDKLHFFEIEMHTSASVLYELG